MIDLIIAASGGAISIAIAWIVAIMRRRETVEARQEIATVRALANLEKTEETITAIEELAKAADREQALADKLNELP